MVDYTPTNRLVNVPVDNRQDKRTPIARSGVITVDSDNHEGTAYDGTDSEIIITNQSIPNGQIVGVAVAPPNIPTDSDFTLDLIDESVDGSRGVTLVSKGSISDGASGNSYVDLVSDNVFSTGKLTVRPNWATTADLTTDRMVFDFVFYVKTP